MWGLSVRRLEDGVAVDGAECIGTVDAPKYIAGCIVHRALDGPYHLGGRSFAPETVLGRVSRTANALGVSRRCCARHQLEHRFLEHYGPGASAPFVEGDDAAAHPFLPRGGRECTSAPR